MSTDTDGARMAAHLTRITDAATALAAEAQRQVNQHAFANDALRAENASLRIVAHNLRTQRDEDVARINALEAELDRLQHLVDESRKIHEANAAAVDAAVEEPEAARDPEWVPVPIPWTVGQAVEWRDGTGRAWPAVVESIRDGFIRTTTENHGRRTFSYWHEAKAWTCGRMTLHPATTP